MTACGRDPAKGAEGASWTETLRQKDRGMTILWRARSSGTQGVTGHQPAFSQVIRTEAHFFVASVFIFIMKRTEVMPRKIIITNNSLVKELYLAENLSREYRLLKIDGGIKEVLTQTRNICHTGGILLSHPLSGSIKPNQTPYKTVVLRLSELPDVQSILIAEESLNKANSLISAHPMPCMPMNVLNDLSEIDLSLFKSFLSSHT